MRSRKAQTQSNSRSLYKTISTLQSKLRTQVRRVKKPIPQRRRPKAVLAIIWYAHLGSCAFTCVQLTPCTLEKRIFKYTDRLGCSLYAVTVTGAIIAGASLPLMTLIFGGSTGTFNNYAVGQVSGQQFQASVDHFVLYFVYLFIGRFVIGYVATLCACIAAARTTNALRKKFLESLLRQGISHFDMQGNGSVATQVTTSMSSRSRHECC